jgi:hypothetical protein
VNDLSLRLRQRLADEARVHQALDTARWVSYGAVIGATVAVTLAAMGESRWPRLAAVAVPVAVAAVLGRRHARARWSAAAVAEAIERRHAADNLVVTAEALGRHGEHPWLARVAEAAWDRVTTIPPPAIRPARIRIAAATAAVIAAVALPAAAVQRLVVGGPVRDLVSDAAVDRLGTVTVRVTHPAYLGGAVEEMPAPPAIDVAEGSTVMLRIEASGGAVQVSRDGDAPRVISTGSGVAELTLPSPPGGTWLLAPERGGATEGARLLTVRVVADAPPSVRVLVPGRDRRQARPLADLPVTLEAQDDHGLRDLHLRFTTVAGSGEGLTFVDRDVPATVTRGDDGTWSARAVLPLASLTLEDGDLVVYRGVAADARPGAVPVESDAFVVEVGPLRTASEAGGGGEDVDPEHRQGISQQMVIVKTERLHAQRSNLGAEAYLAESQGLAVEQRMVRAEFVFLMGGEVQDELEEAAHAHDLVEGRLENQGQAALLGATRAMSRAEARLTTGDTGGALVAEREALRWLRQAFDRRRFLLRPVAERARLDPARRLQGAPPPSTPPSLPVVPGVAPGDWNAVQYAADALAEAAADPARDLVGAAARVAALDRADAATVAAAAALVEASSPAERARALADGRRIVHRVAAARLRPAPPPVDDTGLSGAVADALRRRR